MGTLALHLYAYAGIAAKAIVPGKQPALGHFSPDQMQGGYTLSSIATLNSYWASCVPYLDHH
jgi:hypothetical protein